MLDDSFPCSIRFVALSVFVRVGLGWGAVPKGC